MVKYDVFNIRVWIGVVCSGIGYSLNLVAGGAGRLDHYLVCVEISWCRLGRRVGWGCVPTFGDVLVSGDGRLGRWRVLLRGCGYLLLGYPCCT